MKRGIFNSFSNEEIYSDSKKDWIVELLQSTIFWYDLTKNPFDTFDTKSFIVEYMSQLKKYVENELEKRFIYFIFSRKKIRFNINSKPKYKLLSNELIVEVLIGREKNKRKITCIMPNGIKPRVEIVDKFITFIYKNGDKQTLSIHDFLMNLDIKLDEFSEIHYIGYTKNPDIRPINGNHAGLSDTLYNVSNEDNDIFICFNLFKVTSNALNDNLMINFMLANSMIDEIDVNTEGVIIEKCFILYFNALNQNRNKEKEIKELKNNLYKIAIENNINSIQLNYEFESDNEYWKFFSNNINPNQRHTFTVNLQDEKLIINDGSVFFSKYIH